MMDHKTGFKESPHQRRPCAFVLIDEFGDRRWRIDEGERVQELTPPHQIPVHFRDRGPSQTRFQNLLMALI